MAVVIGATRPSLVIGGRVFTDISSSLIVLLGHVITATRWTTLRKGNGTAGYQVTAAKTLTIEAVRALGGVTGGVLLAYGDNDLGVNAVGPPTTPVYCAGDSAGFNSRIVAGEVLVDGRIFHPYFQVAAAKYLSVQLSGGDANVIAYGYEA